MDPRRNSDGGFVDAVLTIQRLVSAGAPLQDAYQTIIDQAVRLMNGDSGALRLLDLEDPSWTWRSRRAPAQGAVSAGVNVPRSARG